MNKIIFTLIILSLSIVNITAQNSHWIIGANGNYNLPVGSLADRMDGNFGGSFYAGKRLNSEWTWVGKFDYFRLSDVNKDKMFKIIKAEVSDDIVDYKFDLPLLTMQLTVAGLSVEARYNMLSTDFFEADINFGFGFYFWEYFRSGYQDSLFVDTTGLGNFLLVEVINVTPLLQKDWSGGINFGTDINFILFDPLSLNIGFNYKLIIGELWPALTLNLENVSGMQFMDFRAGLRFRL